MPSVLTKSADKLAKRAVKGKKWTYAYDFEESEGASIWSDDGHEACKECSAVARGADKH